MPVSHVHSPLHAPVVHHKQCPSIICTHHCMNCWCSKAGIPPPVVRGLVEELAVVWRVCEAQLWHYIVKVVGNNHVELKSRGTRTKGIICGRWSESNCPRASIKRKPGSRSHLNTPGEIEGLQWPLPRELQPEQPSSSPHPMKEGASVHIDERASRQHSHFTR